MNTLEKLVFKNDVTIHQQERIRHVLHTLLDWETWIIREAKRLEACLGDNTRNRIVRRPLSPVLIRQYMAFSERFTFGLADNIDAFKLIKEYMADDALEVEMNRRWEAMVPLSEQLGKKFQEAVDYDH